MKLSNVVATPISGVYKPPLTVELDCPSVSVTPTSVATSLDTDYYSSRKISKVGNVLYFNAHRDIASYNGLLGIYDINTNTITTVYCPDSTNTASFIYVNGSVYIMGGFDYDNYNIMKYDTDTGTVTTLTQKLPQKMSLMSCNAIGQYIYIIGGRTPIELSTIYRLDTTTDTIEKMSYPLDTACYGSSSAVYKNRYIYVVDGYPTTRKVQIIDTVKGEVSLLSKDLPVPRGSSGAMIKDDFLYVFGGRDSKYRGTVYKKYLLDDSDWVLDSNLLFPRNYFGYTSDEKGYYHIIGGSPRDNGIYYETGRFGLPSSDVEIRYTQTEDGTEPEEPTETTGIKYTEPINFSEVGGYKIKAVAFSHSLEKSNTKNINFFITNNAITNLDYESKIGTSLPIQTIKNNESLKKLVMFYSGDLIIEDSYIKPTVIIKDELTAYISFNVLYQVNGYLYIGNYETEVEITYGTKISLLQTITNNKIFNISLNKLEDESLYVLNKLKISEIKKVSFNLIKIVFDTTEVELTGFKNYSLVCLKNNEWKTIAKSKIKDKNSFIIETKKIKNSKIAVIIEYF